MQQYLMQQHLMQQHLMQQYRPHRCEQTNRTQSVNQQKDTAMRSLGIFAAAAAFLVSAPAVAEDVKVGIGISGWTGFAPLTLANQAGIFKKNGVDGMATRNDVASIKDLKGKTIAASTPGTAPYFTLAWMLKKNGLSVKDVTVVN